MSGIKGQNTKPELVIRRALHARGLRYRLHVKGFPGKPDMLFAKHRAAVFVHGCFWHGHDCALFKVPSTRPEFWQQKIASNRNRDAKISQDINALGWRELVIWECAIRGPDRIGLEETVERAAAWLASRSAFGEVRSIAAKVATQ